MGYSSVILAIFFPVIHYTNMSKLVSQGIHIAIMYIKMERLYFDTIYVIRVN